MLTADMTIITGFIVLSGTDVYVSTTAKISNKINVIIMAIISPFIILFKFFTNSLSPTFSTLNHIPFSKN